MLNHAKDKWLPETLDCLKDESRFILEINEQLQTSLGLYIHMVTLERKSNLSIISAESHINHVRKHYFEPLYHTIEAGLQSLEEQAKSAAG